MNPQVSKDVQTEGVPVCKGMHVIQNINVYSRRCMCCIALQVRNQGKIEIMRLDIFIV